MDTRRSRGFERVRPFGSIASGRTLMQGGLALGLFRAWTNRDSLRCKDSLRCGSLSICAKSLNPSAPTPFQKKMKRFEVLTFEA